LKNKLKYRLPAEWEPHKSTIICWPHQREDWPGKFTPIPWVYTEIIKKIIPGELVKIIVQSSKDIQNVRRYLEKNHINPDKIEFIIAKTDRSWMRDTSPAMVKYRDETVGIRFQFNGWAKYSNWKKDIKIPEILSIVS
jgi:agmatine deiminase